jgi:CheY-like chemotaxis protein
LAFAVQIAEDARGWALGDRDRIAQIVSNILSNAVKFTAQGSVSLAVAREPGGGWRFQVRDTGVGFDPENLSKMFEPFMQLDGSLTRQFGGSGLGLSLAREMARRMGGEIAADGGLGQGAVFTLTMPLRDAEAPAQPGRATPPLSPAFPEPLGPAERPGDGLTPADGAPRVLVVDDNPANRRVIELILTAIGAGFVSAENGAIAVDACTTQAFDAVLMDLQMPVMDGLTAISLIRRHEAETGVDPTPIIVVSANVQDEHLAASAAAGADLHLAKPILAPALLAALDQVLSGDVPAAERQAV